MPALPLEGIRILDIGTRIAAPFAATLLADFGADVIKVELPGRGDFMRNIGPFADGYSLWWAIEGRNKKSITLDLRKERGREIFLDLVAKCDVVVENFRPGTLEKWNIGYERLAERNPGVILTRASVYGQTGPYSQRPGLDRNGISFSGLLYLTGYPDRPPVRPGIIIADYLTGVFNALSIMIALYNRDVQKGGGQSVDLALYESLFRILEHTLPSYDKLGIVRERTGNRLVNSAPLDNWETADGEFISIAAPGDQLFPRLARAMGRPDLIEDPRFSTLPRRAEHSDEINGIVADWCKRHSAAEIERIMLEQEVPVARALSIADIVEDPHYIARESFVTVDDPHAGPIKQPAVYPRFAKTPGKIRHPAPDLGQHNQEIYGKLLGMTAAELDQLRDEGIV
jgi:crotonobetainyl-CoA:carnitine CoA-transferase CaiB-like acyl-CoA transferase